jgi:hypothetical protein
MKASQITVVIMTTATYGIGKESLYLEKIFLKLTNSSLSSIMRGHIGSLRWPICWTRIFKCTILGVGGRIIKALEKMEFVAFRIYFGTFKMSTLTKRKLHFRMQIVGSSSRVKATCHNSNKW